MLFLFNELCDFFILFGFFEVFGCFFGKVGMMAFFIERAVGSVGGGCMEGLMFIRRGLVVWAWGVVVCVRFVGRVCG